MTWSFDDSLATAKDRVRDLIGDIDSSNPILSDESIAVYLSGGSDEQASERLAAASAMEKIANRYAYRATQISEGGASVNWGDIAKRLRDQAASLRALELAGDGTGLFDWAEMAVDPFSAREIVANSVLRSGL